MKFIIIFLVLFGLSFNLNVNAASSGGNTGTSLYKSGKKLIIREVEQANVGKYRVVVENNFSSRVSEEARLDVSYKPKIINIIEIQIIQNWENIFIGSKD